MSLSRLGDEGRVRALLRAQAEVDAKDRSSKTPLYYAAEEGRVGVCRQLLDKGADATEGGGHAWDSPLFRASIFGHEPVVALLLERGAVPPGCDRGSLPLLTSVALCRLAIVRLLAPHVSDDVKRREYAFTPLHEAAFFGDEARVREILGGAAVAVDVNARHGDRGPTPLHLACRCGHVGVARLLLEAGAGTEARTSSGDTPLLEAARCRRADAMRLLLEHGADATAVDLDGSTSLHYAALLDHDDSVAVASLLLERGVAIEARDRAGRTPLLEAIRWQRPFFASFLIERGADVNAADKDGRTPLRVARGKGLRDVARLLEDRGAKE